MIHRDLKPSNIRVGRFGAVYVMDWGLARIHGRSDERDLPVREFEPSEASEPVVPERTLQPTGDSPLHTMDGTPIGTPMFMSPEQASGCLDQLRPTMDVYGLGAILYTLLAGRMPYVEPHATPDGLAIVRQIRSGPPRTLRELVTRATRSSRRSTNERWNATHRGAIATWANWRKSCVPISSSAWCERTAQGLGASSSSGTDAIGPWRCRWDALDSPFPLEWPESLGGKRCGARKPHCAQMRSKRENSRELPSRSVRWTHGGWPRSMPSPRLRERCSNSVPKWMTN